MGWTTTTGNYVKFLRGTPAAWESIATKDGDTLYFICETGATRGKLYLGEKLISDGTTNIINSLSDLSDVLIQNDIPNNALLTYDNLDHVWKPTSLSTIFSLVVSTMTGATALNDGTSGLVPVPVAGDHNKYLRGDGTWANPTESLQQTVDTLVGSDLNKSVRTIATEEVLKVVNGAPEKFDTLKEISDWIDSHDTIIDVADATERLKAVEDTVFGNGTDLNGLVNDVSDIQGDITTINTNITNIEKTLKWKDLVEE